MRVATYNANSIRSRLPAMEGWLAQNAPDVLCVQETKVTDPDFPAGALAGLGYHATFSGQKSYNGVALLSRVEPDEVQAGFDDGGPADASRLLYARFGDWHVVNTYVPQGRALDHEMYAYKLEWYGRLRAFFDLRFTASDLLLWVGDLNVARTPLDVANPETKAQHVCYHTSCREAFEACNAWGFEDLLRRFHADERVYTFYDYRVPGAVDRGLGWRIDYIQASPPAAERASRVWVDLEARRQPKASDHTYLVADFDV